MKKIYTFLDILKKVLVHFFALTFFISLFGAQHSIATGYGREVIPILMSTDNGYVYPTLVSMRSMIKNKNKNVFLEFNIMLSGDISNRNRERFERFGNIYSKDCSVRTLNMGDKFKGVRGTHFPPSAFYRLLAPSYLPQYDKVLYIDGDTLVRHDLRELFNTNIDDYYIAGVKDMGMSLSSDSIMKSYAKNLNIKNMDHYINSGVLLMNLKKMREENIESKFLSYIQNGGFLQYADQEVLNSVCYGKIKPISPVYNDFVLVLGHYNQNRHWGYSDSCSREEWKRIFSDPVIVHYAGGPKPWKTSNVKFYDEWNSCRKEVDNLFYKTINDGVYTIESAVKNNMVLDISNSSRDNEANLQLWESNGTDAQKFNIFYSQEGLYEISPLCSGKRIDVKHSGQANGTNVWQWEANGTDAQKWYIEPTGNGYYNIISKCNGLCLDVHGAQTEKGTNIWCYSKNRTDAQKFRFKVA